MSLLPLIAPLFMCSSLAFQEPSTEPAPPEPAGTQISFSVTSGEQVPATDPEDTRVQNLEQRISELQTQIVRMEAARPVEPVTPPRSSSTSFNGKVWVGPGQQADEAVSFGGPVEVDGEVSGDAVAFGGDVHVSAGGRVLGDAVSFGGKVEVDPGGVVLGDRVAFAGTPEEMQVGGPAAVTSSLAGPLQWAESWLKDQVRRLVLLLSLAGAGVLILGLFPDRVRRISGSLEIHPFKYSIAGLLLSFAGITAVALFGITLIGLPVSGLLLVLMAMGWLLGFVALCQTMGDILPFSSRNKARIVSFLAGIAILGAIGMLPYIGKLILALSLFPCLGAAIATRFGSTSDESQSQA